MSFNNKLEDIEYFTKFQEWIFMKNGTDVPTPMDLRASWEVL